MKLLNQSFVWGTDRTHAGLWSISMAFRKAIMVFIDTHLVFWPPITHKCFKFIFVLTTISTIFPFHSWAPALETNDNIYTKLWSRMTISIQSNSVCGQNNQFKDDQRELLGILLELLEGMASSLPPWWQTLRRKSQAPAPHCFSLVGYSV